MGKLYPATQHDTIRAADAVHLPVGSIVLSESEVADGDLVLDKLLMRVKGEKGLAWENRNHLTSPYLAQGEHLLLYVPRGELAKPGQRLERWMFDLLGSRAVIRDEEGWVAQLTENLTFGHQDWIGPLTNGSECDNDELWQTFGQQGLWLVTNGRDCSPEEGRDCSPEESISDGPQEWER